MPTGCPQHEPKPTRVLGYYQLPPARLKPMPKLPDFTWVSPALSFYLAARFLYLPETERNKIGKRSSPKTHSTAHSSFYGSAPGSMESSSEAQQKSSIPSHSGAYFGLGKHGQGAWLNEYLQAFSDPATALPSQTAKSLHASFTHNPFRCEGRRALPRLRADQLLALHDDLAVNSELLLGWSPLLHTTFHAESREG